MIEKIAETIVVGLFVLLMLGFCAGSCWLSWQKSKSRWRRSDDLWHKYS